ncbi:beta-1,3-glucan-binding protein-like [Athalia rosae]|uniref:beta-1,3-glucan-binding protein-like n=1 Tax=Athalia rosae TaxID=37344 RepID=UPI00203342C0|nr:beta-1,3-glucan-binding protein-like [Athalia rosae]XP_020709230.2 beta-1,3-glucan-binding protein-like [Athalia rosae]XP_048514568.1 beta-1,3-glucan-binding protein-like [Athalia rosae]XP_048514569.1 beta-1,3-glucan-binding protein-like [Athalia rosae]XP_048514570.1 beta-1,3-glucan-binding protein-like [Athalia rosae]XP_048514571.1 beta-1,3-glucan-binding protein-like [Athalia rosae]XP_048514572.1 beta-1,3-glucan-binding protein-like [Athalia rosae]
MKLWNQGVLGFSLLVLQLLFLKLSSAQYEPPKPKILPLYPRGVHFSIPDEEGITLVAFHAKFNEDFNGLEAGTIARDIVRVKNNRWIYEDHTTRLKLGDIIYLWIHVIFEGLGYNLLDQVHHVTEFYNSDGTVHISTQPGPTTDPTVVTTDENPSCRRSETLLNGRQTCAGKLIFEDHFNRLETNQWRIVKEFPASPDYEFVVYRGADENLWVRNGELHIKPTLLENQYSPEFIRRGNLIIEGCTGRLGSEDCEKKGQGFHILPPVSSGLIDTKQHFSFIYGRVEIRAKLPRGDWIYPIIMLKPVAETYGSGYQSGQLRVASVNGNADLRDITGVNVGNRVLQAGAVISPVGPIRSDTMSEKSANNLWSDDYHIFEINWTPNEISVKVDGEVYGTKTNPAEPHKTEIFKNSVNRWHTTNAPFDTPFHISIGVAAGGHSQFSDGSASGVHPKPWRNLESKAFLNFYNAKDAWSSTWTDEESTLKVDYIKVWAL